MTDRLRTVDRLWVLLLGLVLLGSGRTYRLAAFPFGIRSVWRCL